MTILKEKQLEEAYQNLIQALFYSKHFDNLNEFIVEDCMGYGTAIDEKIISINDFRKVAERNREQSAGIDMSIESTPVFRRISPAEDVALIVEELKIVMRMDADAQELFMRISTVLEFIDNKWMTVHSHASVPPDMSENDAWHVKEWERKNEELQNQVNERTKELKKSLEELKAAQAQLIQAEKMASLGVLTAGIAHEIQNPLNFVNNFSEVNKELIEELKGERQKAEGERNAQLEDDLLNNLSNNLEKINHHGKRADAIVKGMLQHSRSSSGVKEPTDINALTDEYLRLAYHGMRAKDKSFNVTMKTDYDERIGNINIIPQDIGRVILNLINNAFYAAPLPPPDKTGRGVLDPNYLHNPTVEVSTKKMGDKVFIRVKDNGPGIPQKILDKIFQPFFTTKPTGQGTGLGLSLSYDIVKAHGGEIRVESKEGEGSEFIIQLPVV